MFGEYIYIYIYTYIERDVLKERDIFFLLHVFCDVNIVCSIVKEIRDNIIKIQGIATTGGWVSGQNSTVPLVFGAYNSSGGGAFAGSLDQARIFNRALDSGEVTQLYNE